VIRIRRLHHVALRTRDAAVASERWARLHALTPAALAGGTALLRCTDEDYGLELIEGDEPGHDHTAYELEGGLTLEAAERGLRDLGVPTTRVDGPCGRAGALALRDPEGNGVHLLEHIEPADRRPYEAKELGTAPAHHPRRVQHVNFLVADIRAWVDFHTDVLGFGVSDWIGDGACWLHVDADHHVLAGMVKPRPHFHHLALELHDFAAMRVALDHLGQHGRWVTWGPGRHTMARNLFSYVRMCEEECFVELFCDMEILRPGHQPRQWPDDVRSSNAWGTLPPRTYFRFDAEAVRIEREQLVNLGLEFVSA